MKKPSSQGTSETRYQEPTMSTSPPSTHGPAAPPGAARTSWACQLNASRQTESLLAYLDALGLVAADHRTQIDGLIHLTLTDREITLLEAHGLSVTRVRPLQTRAQRNDMAAASAHVAGPTDGPGTDTIASGFVTGYMDGVEVTQRVTALALAYPAWASVLSLPFPTSGYDGSLPGAAGPATVLALRITANPALRSRPGFLLIGGTHAREWMNPLIALEFAEQLLANVQPGSVDPEVQAITRIVTEG